jgi:hypothetical protein
MNGAAPWRLATLFLLGAYHGLNPGMGWLFAVALGMQEKSAKAVIRSLVPITLGHALAIGAAVLLADLAQIVLPLRWVEIVVGAALIGLGIYRLVRSRHFRWSRMQVGFGRLTGWSFLMASAHGAGLMVLPVIAPEHPGHAGMGGAGMNGADAILIHTAGYLLVTGAIALLVYQKFGLAMLRTAWLNLDLIWAVALIATGCIALLL